jgi:hypothetical protein
MIHLGCLIDAETTMVKQTRLLCISLLLIPLLRVALGTAPSNLEAQLDSLLAKMTLAEKLDAVSETTLNFVGGCRTIYKRMTNDLTIATMNGDPSPMGNC